MTTTFKQLKEKVLPGQLDRLKKAYEPLRKTDMSKHTDAIKQATAMLNKIKDSGTLRQLAVNDIPVVSDVAKNLMKRRGITETQEGGPGSGPQFKSAEDELKKRGNIRVGKTDSQGNWHSVSTSDKKEIEKLKSQGYEVVDEAKNPHQDGNTLSPGENKDINKQRQNQLNKKAALVKKFAQIEKGRKATALADPIKYKMDADNSASSMPYTHYRSKAASYAANVRPDYYFKKEQLEEADLSKAQIKMVHKQADELPKHDFIKRYGKDGDAVRFATATNQVKKKLGIEEGGPDKALKKEVIRGVGTNRGSNRGDTRGLPAGSIEKGGPSAYTGQVPLWKRALKALDTWIITSGEEVELEEGTWSLPTTSKQANQLRKLLKKPLRADVALDKLYNLIGDDELSDTIEGIKRVDPKTDVRHIIVRRLKQLGFKSYSAESVDEEVELTEKKWPLDMYQGDDANKLNPMVLKIRKLTDRNDHFGARIELAKIAGDKNLQTAYEGLEIAHITAANQAGNHAIILREKIGPYLRASIVRKFGNQKGPTYASRLMDAL